MKNPLSPQVVRAGWENSRRRKKLGFDLHGVIDANSSSFRLIMRDLISQGWEIHIITGAPWKKEAGTLRRLKIPFTHFFSIVDYHIAIKTPIEWDEKGNAHLDPYLWDKTKGQYCEVNGITLHCDDSDIYGRFFKTPYLRYYSNNSERIKKIHLS